MKITNFIALTLVVIGALNWGLIGFFGYDVVTALFHENLFWIARTIFALVGLAGIWCLTFSHSVQSLGGKPPLHKHGGEENALYKNAGLRKRLYLYQLF